MNLIELHDKNNPERVVPIDADDFSAAFPYLGGAMLRLKDGDALYPVAETPEAIAELLRAATKI